MTIGSIAFVSCNKENELKNNTTELMEKIEKKEDLLSKPFIVAHSQSDTGLYEGDTIPMLFNKKDFLSAFEDYIIDFTQENWVAEDVSVSLYRLNENTVQPALHISLYNTMEETGKNIYIFLAEGVLLDGCTGYSFVANSSESITCTSTNCSGGCDPVLNESTGKYDCSPCPPKPYTYSSCTKTSTINVEKTAICMALNDVL